VGVLRWPRVSQRLLEFRSGWRGEGLARRERVGEFGRGFGAGDDEDGDGDCVRVGCLSIRSWKEVVVEGDTKSLVSTGTLWGCLVMLDVESGDVQGVCWMWLKRSCKLGGCRV